MRLNTALVRPGCALLAAVAACAPANGQCTQRWSPEFGPAGAPFTVNAMAQFDDGSGPALYAGGAALSPFGPDRIGRWDGSAWSDVAGGISHVANSFCGCAAQVFAMKVFDDGSGSALFVGGSFLQAGGVSAGGIARFDGAGWSAVGPPLTLPGCADCPPTAYAFTTFDAGAGEQLYAGGWFTEIGRTVVNNLARWNGSAWQPIGGVTRNRFGVEAQVRALTAWDDGRVNALYVGGSFDNADSTPADSIARWDGSLWAPLGSGVDGNVAAMAVFDDGSGQALFVAGQFTTAGRLSVRNIATWDGGAWNDVGGGFNGRVNALSVFDDGTGPALYAAGDFTLAGGVFVGNIARWDGANWSDVSFGVDGEVFALAPANIRGPGLYVGGIFNVAGGRDSPRIAKWAGCEVCYADCDGNGELDIFDFLCFQNSFVLGEPYACDCDPDPACDIFDFLCFQSAFVTGCP